jgi:hypothetical protein
LRSKFPPSELIMAEATHSRRASEGRSNLQGCGVLIPVICVWLKGRPSQSAASQRAGEELPICLMVSCGVVFCVKFFVFLPKNSRKLRLIPLNEAMALRPLGHPTGKLAIAYNIRLKRCFAPRERSEQSWAKYGRAGENRRF